MSAPGLSALDNLPPLRDVIRRHELAAKKSLGQNFLLDLNLTGRIARAAGAVLLALSARSVEAATVAPDQASRHLGQVVDVVGTAESVVIPANPL